MLLRKEFLFTGIHTIKYIEYIIFSFLINILFFQLWNFRHIVDLAENREIILPISAFNVINGGSHINNKFSMQELVIFLTGNYWFLFYLWYVFITLIFYLILLFCQLIKRCYNSFTGAMKIGAEVYHHLKNVINNVVLGTNIAKVILIMIDEQPKKCLFRNMFFSQQWLY